VDKIDPSWKGFYKISGISLLITALFFFIAIVLTLCQTMALGPTVERLEILARQQALVQLSNGSFIVADIFSILGMLGVYLALHNLGKNQALVGATLGILGAALAVAARFGVYAEAMLASHYVNAASEGLQSGYVAAAELAKAFTDSGLLISNLLLGAGWLIIGFVMLAGVFRKRTAYLLIISYILYIVSFVGGVFVPILVPIVILACLLAIISEILIGLRLYAIGNLADLG